jgi:hypothetical protein
MAQCVLCKNAKEEEKGRNKRREKKYMAGA